MARRTGKSRVGGGSNASHSGDYNPTHDEFPSLRQRRPIVYWIVIFVVGLMVFGTIAGAISAIV